jgi:hypothetical protein
MVPFKKTRIKQFIIIISIAIILTPLSTASFTYTEVETISQVQKKYNIQQSDRTEYWGLIFAVGEYYNNPDQNRPSMLEAADNLYEVLIDSPHWQPDHLHLVKGSQATGQALIRELIWLSQNDDSDDMALIYLTTHGSPLKNGNGLPVDLPPKDENDGADEILVMYHGFDRWYAFIWDDLLNFFISLLSSKGVCLIVDSCYSGGFNDYPAFGQTNMAPNYSAADYITGMTEELAAQNRVVLMSSEEHTVSYGSDFSDFIIQGFWGWADLFGNQNGETSAEESFFYAQFWVDLIGNQHPTILDLYPGEFLVTT